MGTRDIPAVGKWQKRRGAIIAIQSLSPQSPGLSLSLSLSLARARARSR